MLLSSVCIWYQLSKSNPFIRTGAACIRSHDIHLKLQLLSQLLSASSPGSPPPDHARPCLKLSASASDHMDSLCQLSSAKEALALADTVIGSAIDCAHVAAMLMTSCDSASIIRQALSCSGLNTKLLDQLLYYGLLQTRHVEGQLLATRPHNSRDNMCCNGQVLGRVHMSQARFARGQKVTSYMVWHLAGGM